MFTDTGSVKVKSIQQNTCYQGYSAKTFMRIYPIQGALPLTGQLPFCAVHSAVYRSHNYSRLPMLTGLLTVAVQSQSAVYRSHDYSCLPVLTGLLTVAVHLQSAVYRSHNYSRSPVLTGLLTVVVHSQSFTGHTTICRLLSNPLG